jgi:predicted small secreted protein
MTEPLITDWINSFATLLGIPIVIVGLFKLFIQDKSKERKLNSLEKLALTQVEMIKKMTEQVTELSKQTSEFQYQSELMKDSNQIISKQLELNKSIFLHTMQVDEKRLDLQRIKRVNEIKPRFIYAGGTTSSGKITILLKNKGNIAKHLRIENNSDQYVTFSGLSSKIEIEKDKPVELIGNVKSNGRFSNNADRLFEAQLYFEDIDGNKYKQRIFNNGIGELEAITE